MSKQTALEHLKKYGVEDRIFEFKEEEGTVKEVAIQINTSEDNIAKTLSFIVEDRIILIVISGDKKVYSGGFKKEFGVKPHMIPRNEVEEKTGFIPGSVSPFGTKEGCEVYLDVSLKGHEYLYPSCGAINNAIKLSLKELEEYSEYIRYVDVTK